MAMIYPGMDYSLFASELTIGKLSPNLTGDWLDLVINKGEREFGLGRTLEVPILAEPYAKQGGPRVV
jgi:hypothetical protein